MSSNNQKQFSDRTLRAANFDAASSEDVVRQAPAAGDAGQMDHIAERTRKKTKTKANKKLIVTGLIFAGLFAVSLYLMTDSPTVNTSEEAVQALESGMSTTLPVGVRIQSNDECLDGQDLTITHSSREDECKIYIWDYAAEDGDYVQVIVDGIAICDPFMIKHDPVAFTVPAVGEIQVLGTRDGGGGITYAVHCDVNETTYFNGTDVGDGNLYTLIRE